jgi:diguanylate cyclase (GGDEF)-like protein
VRNGHPLSLAMTDVDFFKPFNDNYGHAAGDRVLQTVAGTLMETLQRPGDMAARYGGEEFVLLFPETEPEDARQLAERARSALTERAIPHAHNDAADHVTISVGGSGMTPSSGQSPHALVEAADARLYLAKERGRNRVIFAED